MVAAIILMLSFAAVVSDILMHFDIPLSLK